MTKNWKIILAGNLYKTSRLKKKFIPEQENAHSFLALVDQFGNVASELHPMSYYPSQDKVGNGKPGTKRYYKNKPKLLITSLAKTFNILSLLNKTGETIGLKKHFPIIRNVTTNRNWKFEEADVKIDLIESDESTARQIWQDLNYIAKTFNQMKLPYVKWYINLRSQPQITAQNCNSMVTTLLALNNIPLPSNDNYKPVGIENNLERYLTRNPRIFALDFLL